jgi:methionyl aminopeptidase
MASLTPGSCKKGDIVNVDVTAYLGGVHADTSATFAVGQVNNKVGGMFRLAETTIASMCLCI